MLKCRVAASQSFSIQWEVRLSSVEIRWQSYTKNTCCVIGALCKAAYNDNNPNALAEVFPSMNEVEIQGVKDFVKRFGCKLAILG